MASVGKAFMADVMRLARRAPPPAGKAAQRVVTDTNNEEVFLDMGYAVTRRNYVMTQDLLVSGLAKIDVDVHGSGMTLEVYNGEQRLETSKEEQRLFDMHVPDVARNMHLDWFANGYSAVQPARDSSGFMLARVLEYSEYVVSFIQRDGRIREYRVYDAEGERELHSVRLYLLYPPNLAGRPCTPLDSVWRYLRLLESAYEDESYAQFHRTHPPFVVQPPTTTRTRHDDVLREGVYADADDQEDDSKKRFTIMKRVEEETRVAVESATDASLSAMQEATKYAASIYGYGTDPSHPRVQAAANPPYMTQIVLGQDTQMAPNVPVPQQHGHFREFETAITMRVYTLMGLPPQLMTATVEKFASETSLVLRLYNSTVQRLQTRLSAALSDLWTVVNVRNYKRAQRRSYDEREPPKADEIMEAARRARRNESIAALLERYRCVVLFDHLPVIEMPDLIMLHQSYVISEDEFVRMAAARFNVRKDHALLTQEQRDAERKRRLKTVAQETSTLAQASLVEVGTEGGGVGEGKPRPKRQAVGPAITSAAKPPPSVASAKGTK